MVIHSTKAGRLLEVKTNVKDIIIKCNVWPEETIFDTIRKF